MQRKLLNFYVLPFFIVLFFLIFCHHANANNLSEGEKRRIIANLANDWKKYLGDIDCSDEFLFQRMVYLKPQAFEKFKNFENLQLSPSITLVHDMWLRSHFKGNLLEKLQNLKPSAYYLRKGQYDESLLLYQTQLAGSKISLLENYTVSFITFTPEGFDVAKGINKEYLEKILSEWLNLGERTDSIKKLLKHQVYLKGMIFANNPKESHVLFMPGWQDDIICFLTEKGVSFLLFRVSSERAFVGIPTNLEWLDKGEGLLDIEIENKQ